MEGRLLGVRLRFDFSFFLLVVLFLLGDQSGSALFILGAAAIHEGGHLLMMGLAKAPVEAIWFTPFGLRITRGEGPPLSYGAEAAVTLGGSAANLAGALLWSFLPIPGALTFSAFQLVLGLLNLLPAENLDGGKLLGDTASRFLGEREARWLCRIVTLSLLAGLWAGGLALLRLARNPSLCLLCGYLTLSLLREG